MQLIRAMASLMAVAALVWTAPALFAQDAQPKEDKPVEKPAEEPKQPEKKEEVKEEPKKEEPKEEENVIVTMVKGLDQVTGKVEATEEDFKQFFKLYPEMRAALKGDKEFKAASSTSLKLAYDHMLKNEKLKAWAKEKGHDLEKLGKITMRIMSTHLKVSMRATFKGVDEQIAEGRKQIEGLKDQMPAKDYEEALKSMDDAAKEIAVMKKAFETIPGPTEAETKLLEANKEALETIMNEDDEDEAEEADGDDGMGGK